jgi:hypothetical protein
MQSTDATRGHGSDLSDHFWDRYVESLQAKRVKLTAVRWYVIRAEQYLQAVVHQRLAEHTPQEVTDYLEKLGRIGSIEAWQYGQIVDAIQHLFLVGEVAWAQYFDWAYWKASARTLPVAHPTIAREATTVTMRGKTTQKQTGSVSLARVRDTHASSLDALLAEIRRWGH